MNICIFCGSSTGTETIYAEKTKELAQILVQVNATLVYGGGNIGLMGILADEMLQNHCKVIGVIPDFLMQQEVGHTGVTQLEVVSSMHERKKRMADLTDVFIALPGGWGTLDELAEILTWKQLGLIEQPVGLLNINSYFSPLIEQMQKMVSDGFLQKSHFTNLKVEENPRKLLKSLRVLTA